MDVGSPTGKREYAGWQLPRDVMLTRIPQLEHAVGRPSGTGASDLHFASNIRSLIRSCSAMAVEDRAIAESGLMTLLPIVSLLKPEGGDAKAGWLARSIAILDAQACDAGFDPPSLARQLGVAFVDSRYPIDPRGCARDGTLGCEPFRTCVSPTFWVHAARLAFAFAVTGEAAVGKRNINMHRPAPDESCALT